MLFCKKNTFIPNNNYFLLNSKTIFYLKGENPHYKTNYLWPIEANIIVKGENLNINNTHYFLIKNVTNTITSSICLINTKITVRGTTLYNNSIPYFISKNINIIKKLYSFIKKKIIAGELLHYKSLNCYQVSKKSRSVVVLANESKKDKKYD